jgi:hypothetical protein
VSVRSLRRGAIAASRVSALSPFDALSAEVLADSPAGFWPLNETSGTTANDISGNARHGTYTSSYALASAVGSLLAVDLTGGYVNVPDNAAFSAGAGASGLMTVEAWVRFDTLAAQMNIVTKGAASNYEFDFRLGDSVSNALAAVTYTSAGGGLMATTQTAGQVAATTDYHLAMTLDYAAKLLIVYRNGAELVRDSASSSPSEFSSNGTAALQIGRRGDAAGAVLDGKIGCVAYYPTALSAARILAHYEAGT